MISIIPILIILGLLLFSAPSSLTAQNLDIYVSAHPDDWQLFMNPNAYHSVKDPATKVIFLHITAGDAGHGADNDTYYLAREKGSLRAIRFLVNSTKKVGLGSNMNAEKANVDNHIIRKFTYANTVAYFLRLPDGNLNGSGYRIHNYSSLRKLYNGAIPTISAIDRSTKYTSLNDLEDTIRAILKSESEASDKIQLHLPDTDIRINPDDHYDHLYSSHLVQDIVDQLNVTAINLYRDYDTKNMSQNIYGSNYLICAGTWAVTASGLSDYNYNSTWGPDHNIWIGKQYFRELQTSGSIGK